MFHGRQDHIFHGDGRSCHSQAGRFKGRSGCGSLGDIPCGGRAVPFYGRRGTCSGHRDDIAWGREGACRLEDALHQRRRGSMGGLSDGLVGLTLGGGVEGLGDSGSPMLPRGPFPPRGAPSLGGRSPLLDDDFLGHRHGSHFRGGSSLSGFGSRTRLGGLSPLMSGSPGLGLRSPMGSSSSMGNFDLYRMDRPRMPYGPRMGGLANYQSPYVEDYESLMDEDERRERRLQLMEMLARDGIMHSPFLDDHLFGDDYGDLRGRRLR